MGQKMTSEHDHTYVYGINRSIQVIDSFLIISLSEWSMSIPFTIIVPCIMYYMWQINLNLNLSDAVWLTALGVLQASQRGCRQSGWCSWTYSTLSSLSAPDRDEAPPMDDIRPNKSTYGCWSRQSLVSELGSSRWFSVKNNVNKTCDTLQYASCTTVWCNVITSHNYITWTHHAITSCDDGTWWRYVGSIRCHGNLRYELIIRDIL